MSNETREPTRAGLQEGGAGAVLLVRATLSSPDILVAAGPGLRDRLAAVWTLVTDPDSRHHIGNTVLIRIRTGISETRSKNGLMF